MSMLRSGLKIADTALLVGRKASHAQKPANWSSHAADHVLAEPCREQGIVAIVAHGEQLLGRCGSLFCEVQRSQVALLDQRCIVGLQAGTQRERK